jgi:predicted RNA polymerase sigma factor
MCCHPALTPASAIALTLRAVGGLDDGARSPPPSSSRGDDGAADLAGEAADPRVGRPVPDASAEEREARLRSVLHVLYLIFNEGYTAASGRNLLRVELSTEAIRLTRMVHAELPDDPKSRAPGADAADRRATAARLDANGEPIPLPEQDRSRWDHAQIAEGLALLDEAIAAGRVGEYQLDAAIAAVHDRAPSAAATDWSQILALYELLERMTGNPIVTVNRAVAASMVHGPAAGLEILAAVEPRLEGTTGSRPSGAISSSRPATAMRPPRRTAARRP